VNSPERTTVARASLPAAPDFCAKCTNHFSVAEGMLADLFLNSGQDARTTPAVARASLPAAPDFPIMVCENWMSWEDIMFPLSKSPERV